MIKVLDRYILRGYFTNYAIAFVVLVGLYVILDLFINLDEFTGIGTKSAAETIVQIIDFYGHNMFLYFAQLSGAISLMAGCFALGRLHRANELTAVLATGTSLYRVAAPILLAGLGMNVLWFVDQEFIIPDIADKLARQHDDIEGRRSFQIWFMPDPDHENSLLSAQMFHPGLKEMRGLIVIQRDERQRMSGMIQADQAKWDEERQEWRLRNGYRRRLGAAAGGADELQALAVYRSGLTPKELALQQATQWTMFLSLRELHRLQGYFGERNAAEFVKVKHSRLTTVVMNMTLLCLGIPFFLNRERPSVVIQGGKCLLVCGLCYVTTFFCGTIDLTPLGVSAALSPWLPILVFVPVAVVLLDMIKT